MQLWGKGSSKETAASWRAELNGAPHRLCVGVPLVASSAAVSDEASFAAQIVIMEGGLSCDEDANSSWYLYRRDYSIVSGAAASVAVTWCGGIQPTWQVETRLT